MLKTQICVTRPQCFKIVKSIVARRVQFPKQITLRLLKYLEILFVLFSRDSICFMSFKELYPRVAQSSVRGRHLSGIFASQRQSQWSLGLSVRLHGSQNRHNTANQHLSGYTLQERVATFNP